MGDNGNLKDLLKQCISISEFSRNPSAVVKDVISNRKRYIIVKNNVHAVVLLSMEEYMELVDTKGKTESKQE